MTVKVDDRQVIAALKKGMLSVGDMLDIEKPMALTIVNKQRLLVPKKTHATENSVGPEIQSATDEKVVDHIGPETDYAPFIEDGITSKPNYPIQPFVRPSVQGNERNIEKVASAAFKAKIKQKYGFSPDIGDAAALTFAEPIRHKQPDVEVPKMASRW